MDEIKKIINYAYENSQFYKELYNKSGINLELLANNEQITKYLPIVSKENLRDNLDLIVIDKFKFVKSKNIQSVYTSGSTGLMVEIKWLKDDYYKSNIELWRKRKKWYNINANSKKIDFHGIVYWGSRLAKTPKITYKNNNRTLSLSKFHFLTEDILEYYKEITEFNPDWMSIQPSLILKMIDVFENYNLKPFPTLKYIELNGEVVTEFAKKRIKSFFNIPIANMYGANEVNGIALECPNGHMHILEQNVFVDIRKDNHNNNTILVTSLKNTVTPIINYDLGDLVELDYIDCKCGERGRIVKIISGRIVDMINIDEKHMINPYIFSFAIEKINSIFDDPILEFKILQNDNDKIIMLLKVKKEFKNWKKTIEEELLNILQEIKEIEILKIEIVFVENIPLIGNKFKIFEKGKYVHDK